MRWLVLSDSGTCSVTKWDAPSRPSSVATGELLPMGICWAAQKIATSAHSPLFQHPQPLYAGTGAPHVTSGASMLWSACMKP